MWSCSKEADYYYLEQKNMGDINVGVLFIFIICVYLSLWIAIGDLGDFLGDLY